MNEGCCFSIAMVKGKSVEHTNITNILHYTAFEICSNFDSESDYEEVNVRIW